MFPSIAGSIASSITPSFTSSINPGGNMDEKVLENRLRRAAQRQGLILRKSRRRDRRAVDYGVYFVADAERNILDQRVDQRNGLTLDEVEALLEGKYDRFGRAAQIADGMKRTREHGRS